MMKILKWVGGLSLLGVLVGIWYAFPQLKIGAGYAAKMACSCYYLQGRSLQDIQARDLNFSVLPQVRLSLNETQQSVTASFFGLISQTAYFLGDGCTLQAEPSRDLPDPYPVPIRSPLALATYDTFPAALDTSLLSAAADLAFKPLPGGGTRALVMLHDGRLVYERYAPGFGPDTPLLGWSMTKSIVNALLGLASKYDFLQLKDRALFPEWQADARAEITVEDLLQMNSGLEWNEAYGSVSDATHMLYRQAAMGQYAVEKKLEVAPGQYWEYSSGTSNILSQLLRQKSGNKTAYRAMLYDSLFASIGMHSARIERDQSDHYVGSSYGWATARDWARFGQLYLQQGRWNGKQLLPAGWVDFSRQAAEGSNGIYGAHIWLQTADARSAPADVFMFRGFQDQRIVIIPSRQVVLVRLGMNADQTFPLDDFLQLALKGFPAVVEE
ncbi:MAG: class C beta-lactamase-related serine hydrolase [Bacteroidetes bacterium]|nr:MAG: class C beta-lactamase-related serine hydrolase [Bacteroidota bacterium]